MENLSGLTIFVRVAATRSFVEAGRQLGLSASAVGKAVARLEQRLGARLLNRTTHQVSLTADGTLFLDRARRVLAELDQARLELSAARQLIRGPLRVTLPSWTTGLMPLFSRFLQAHPQIDLELDLNDRLVDLVGEGYDLAIRAGELRASSLMSRTIGRFRHCLIAAPAYLAAHGIPDRPARLADHRCLHRRHPETGLIDRWPLTAAGAALTLELPVTAIVNSVEARIALAEQGAGIACVPSIAVTSQLADGRLLSLLDDHLEDSGVLRLLWAGGGTTPPNVRALVDFITAAGELV